MDPTTRTVQFEGDRAITAPLTWGQQALWAAIGRTRPEDRNFNFSRVLNLPEDGPDLTLEDVDRAVAAVLHTHEGLRARLADEGDTPCQTIADRGRFAYLVVEAGAQDLPEFVARVRQQLDDETFDYVGEWPLRLTVVTRAGRPEVCVFGFCHMATDFGGSVVVIADFGAALRDPAHVVPEAPNTVDLALRQHGPDGKRANDAALAYWEDGFRRMPATMFTTELARPQEPRYWVGNLSSPAVREAVGLIGARLRVPTASVLTAAFSAVAAELAGLPSCAMLVIGSNRYRPERRRLVSTVSMEGLLLTEIDRASSFDELVTRHAKASLKMFKYAEYDETGREEVIARVSRERGEQIHPYCCMNDMRFDDDRSWEPADPPIDPRDLLGKTVFGWERALAKVACRFCLHVTGLRGADLFEVRLTADTAYLPPAAIEGYLRAVEGLLVESVAGGFRLAGLAAVFAEAGARPLTAPVPNPPAPTPAG